MTKSFHPGRAAQNGVTAAVLASRNYTSSVQSLEAKYGWAHVLSTGRDFSQITNGLGDTYEIALNTYKPFACGLFMHPTIDGCIQLRNEHKLTADVIVGVDLTIHPLAFDLTGQKTPATGLESKFSIYHAASVALIDGAAGESQFSDSVVRNPAVVALRGRISAVADAAIRQDQVRIVVRTTDGRRLEKFIEHAVGGLENPMSDRDLEAKFTALGDGVLPADRLRRVMELCWDAASLPDVGAIARAAAA